MKAAVQISGQPRDFKRVYNSMMEHIVKPLGADIFISCWNSQESQRFDNDGSVEDFIDLYNPRSYRVDIWDEQEKEKHRMLANMAAKNCRPEITPMFVISAAYQLMNVNKLISKDYDVVVKARTELTFDRPLSDREIEAMQKNIWIPRGHDSLGINDIIAFGPRRQIEQYSYLYNYYSMYVEEGFLFHPELLLKEHLNRFAIVPDRFEFPMYLRGEKVT